MDCALNVFYRWSEEDGALACTRWIFWFCCWRMWGRFHTASPFYHKVTDPQVHSFSLKSDIANFM